MGNYSGNGTKNFEKFSYKINSIYSINFRLFSFGLFCILSIIKFTKEELLERESLLVNHLEVAFVEFLNFCLGL